MNVYPWYGASRWLYERKVPVLPDVIKGAIRVVGGVIPYQASIGEGTILGYQAEGIVIHKRCVIGKNCHISQNVTIGGTSGIYKVPVLGDNVQVGAGAVIIGPVHIGDNVIIGANAVVNKDIPANIVAVGVPAKVIKTIEPGSDARI
jgi:serine O-acetyltransferase